ncbi:MAG: DUF58 domain-containing protein [Verrucomicrobiota bacterium]|nr:DUF58 domain-containing protein [Verrucomicrobiota bacterium]
MQVFERRAGTLVDPQALMRIRSLEFRARVVVDGFWSGLHRSPHHGFSVEFTEYRQYSPGDDPRYVDWRVYARSDRYFVKRFEDETNMRCNLVVDMSRSMCYGSVGYTKSNYAATLAATLACFLGRQGDAVGLVTFDERVRDYLPARHRHGHLRRLMLLLERDADGVRTDLVAPLRRTAELVRKRGVAVVISDFLAPIDQIEPAVLPLLSCGHEVVMFQVLDPAELAFEFSEPAVFEDVESGRTLLLDPGAVRRDYKIRVEAHSDALRRACERWNGTFFRVATDRPIELALFDFLSGRHALRRRVRRAERAGR